MNDEIFLVLLFIAIVLVVIYKCCFHGEYGRDIFLGPGTWIVGIDLPPGKGDLIAETGAGSFCVKEFRSKEWSVGGNIGVTSGLQPGRYRNLDLHPGDTLEINGNVNIMITAPVAIRDITEENLGPGNYRFGVDVPPGKYDLEVVSGDGQVYLILPRQKEYSFYQDMDKDGGKTHEYANLRCPRGAVLWIEGSLQIKLKFSAKQDIWMF